MTDPKAAATSHLRRLLPLVAIYVAIMGATRAAYFADTVGYAQNILAFHNDPSAGRRDFWDFGHLLLRPLGWLLFHAFGGLFSYTKTGEGNLAVVAVLMGASILGGLVAFVLLQALARRLFDRGWVAGFVAVAFVCFQAFLNYAQTGTAYIVGLMCLTLSVWSAVRAVEVDRRGRAYAVLSGVAAATSALFWFPYSVAVPGILAIFFLWPVQDNLSDRSRRIGLTVVMLACALVSICGAYGMALVSLDIHSVAALKQWVVASGHGWTQSKRLLRIATGLPRSFLWIGDEGTAIKRYLLHDPYARVTLSGIMVEQFWRIIAFYFGAGCLLQILFRSVQGRRILWILAAGTVPVLLFAVLVFEPGSIERYLPIYPFLCFAVAFCLSQYRENRVAVGGLVAFLAVAMLVNVTALWRSSALKRHRPTEDRALSLAHKVGPQGLVALLSLSDDLYQLIVSFPFDTAVRRTSLPVYDVVQVSNERVRTWKQEFAQKALNALKRGQAVWISKRLLAAQPQPAWGWTEGDDPNVSWKDLRPFFSALSYSEDVGGSDGFLQIADTEQNKACLTEAADGGG